MTDLASWLLEQIADDELVASKAGYGRREWEWRYPGGVTKDADGLWAHNRSAPHENQNEMQLWSDPHGQMNHGTAVHIAAWAPSRVLAECEAKRRIVEAHHAELMEVVDGVEHWTDCADCRQGPPCHTLRLLALPYADREGYREEWRP